MVLLLILTAPLLASGEDLDLCAVGCQGIKCVRSLIIIRRWLWETLQKREGETAELPKVKCGSKRDSLLLSVYWYPLFAVNTLCV